MRVLGLVVILLALVATSGCLSGGPLTGKPAPAFQLTTSEGVVVNNTTYLGRYVILDLMATWCGPCKLEVGHLKEVQRLHGDDVVILSIGTDPTESLADLERFEEEHGATWPYALDRTGDVKRAMQMRIIPKLVIIDPQGIVVFEREGEVLPAAITRVVDPSAAAPPAVPVAAALAALGLGFLAAHNPYRRLHRDAPGALPTLLALAGLALAALLAWRFSGVVSTRATYGSLFIGAASLGAAAWWWRARRKDAPGPGGVAGRAGDRAYELAPHFAGALVLGLTGAGAVGFFAPLAGFLAGASAGLATRARVPERASIAAGLVGLALVGVGLVAFGARILTA